jgi:hypothetical protein
MSRDPEIERVREALRRHDRDGKPDAERDEEERVRESLREHDREHDEDGDA